MPQELLPFFLLFVCAYKAYSTDGTPDYIVPEVPLKKGLWDGMGPLMYNTFILFC